MQDIANDIRLAMISNQELSGDFAVYNGDAAIFTGRIPTNALTKLPNAVVRCISLTDMDAVNSLRPIIRYDVLITGRPDTNNPQKARIIDELGFKVRNQFHRKRQSIETDVGDVVQIICSGPFIAPVSDPAFEARLVSLSITLREKE